MSFAKYREEQRQKKKEAAGKQQVKKTGFAAYREQLHAAPPASSLGTVKTAISALPETSAALSTDNARTEKMLQKHPERYAAAKEHAEKMQDPKYAAEYEKNKSEYDAWWGMITTDVSDLEDQIASLEKSRPVYIHDRGFKAENDAAAAKNAEIDKQVAALKAEMLQAKTAQYAYRYSLVPKRSDYAELSVDERHAGTNLYDSVFGRDPYSPDNLSTTHRKTYDGIIAEYESLAAQYGEDSAEAQKWKNHAEQYLLMQLGNGVTPTIANADKMTEDEKNTFRYILNKEGEQAALEYLGFIQEDVNARASVEETKRLQEIQANSKGAFGWLEKNVSPVIHSFFNELSGDPNLGVKNPVTGAIAPSKGDFTNASMREDAGWFTGLVMDAAGAAGAMMPSIALSAVNPLLGSAAMSARIFGESTNSALREGKSREDAFAYGLSNAVLEFATSRVLGGIGGLSNQTFGKKVAKTLDKALGGTKKWIAVLARGAGITAANAVSEGFEEWLQSELDPIIRNTCFNEHNEVKLFSSESLYEGLVGAVTAVFLGGTSGFEKASYQESINRHLQATSQFKSDKVTSIREELQDRLHDEDAEPITKGDLKRLYEAVATEIFDTYNDDDSSVRTAEEIGEVLKKDGVDAQQAGEIARALEAFSRGETPTAEQLELVKSTEQSRKLFSEYFGKDIDLDADGALAAVIARVDRDGEVEKDPYEAVRSHLSEDGRIALDAAIRHAGDATPSAVAATVEQQYLKGFTGAEYQRSANFMADAIQRAAYDAGVEARANLGKVTVAEGITVSDEFRTTLARVAKDLHTHITYGGTAPTRNGVTERGYSTKYGELHIYADAKVKGANGTTLYGERAAAVIIAGHELTHRLQQLAPSEYAAFRAYAVAQKGGDKAVAKYMRKYDLDDTDAMDEIAANFAMTTLFFDEKTIREITKKRSKLAQAIRSILQWIKDKLHFKTSDIDRAIRLWNDAYNASRRSAKDPQVHDDVAEGKEEVKHSRNPNLDEHGKVKYNSSIKWVYDAGLFDGGQARYFYSVVADIKQKKYKTFVKARTGERIIPVDNMLVYFHGGFMHPKISQIVRINFDLKQETEIDIVRNFLYAYEKGESDYHSALQAVKNLFGDGRISTYYSEDHNADVRQTGNEQRTDSRETSRNSEVFEDGRGNDNASRGADNLTDEADSDGSAFSMPKKSLSGSEELMEELAVEAEQEKKTAHEIARNLMISEAGERANGRKYVMDLDTFKTVVSEYSIFDNKKFEAVLANKMYLAAVDLAAAYNTRGKMKQKLYQDAYFGFLEAARTLETKDAELVAEIAAQMLEDLLEAGYENEIANKNARETARETFMSAKDAKMDMALSKGWRGAFSEAFSLADVRKKEGYEKRIDVLKSKNEKLKAERNSANSTARRKYLGEYRDWKVEYHKSDTRKKRLDRIEKNMATLCKWATKADKQGHSVPDAALKDVLEIFWRVDMQLGEAATLHNIQWQSRVEDAANALYARKVLEKQIEDGTLPNTFRGGIPTAVALKLHACARDIGSGNIYSMNEKELTALDEALDILKTNIANANKMFIDGKKVEVKTVAEQEIKRLRSLPKSKVGEKTYDFFDSFTYAEVVGGFFGDTLGKLRGRFNVFVKELRKVEKFTRETVKGRDRQAWRRSVKKITLGGQEVYVTDAQLMSLYLLNKREAAHEHLYGTYDRKMKSMRGGGIQIDHRTLDASGDLDAKRFAKEHKKETISHITEAEVEAACAQLSPLQTKIADALSRYMSDKLGTLGNEVSMKLYGYRAYGERHYFPMNVSGDTLGTDVGSENTDNIFAIMNAGMTKHLTKRAINGLQLLDVFDVYEKHVSEMLNYYAYTEVFYDALRVMNYKPTVEVYAEDGGLIGEKQLQTETVGGRLNESFPGAREFFENQLRAFNSQKAFGTTAFDSLLSKATSMTKGSQMGLNLRVIVQQPTSYLRAGALLNLKHWIQGLNFTRRVPKNLLYEYCPIAQWKAWGFYDTDIGPSLDSLLFGDRNAYEWAKDKQMFFAEKMDNMTFNALYRACEAEVRDEYRKAKKRAPAEDEITYEELIRKDPMRIVELSENKEHLIYAQLKQRVLARAEKERWFDEPYENADTGMQVFIGKDAFTHAFSNLTATFGEDTVLAMEQIPEIVKNAVLTHIAPPKNPNKAETKVYTLFAAVRGRKGVEPVKLTVKEYDTNSVQRLPSKIEEYFEKTKKEPTYRRLYDAKVLEVISVEKTEPDASAADIGRRHDVGNTPDSTISIAELLELVKGDAEKYIPKAAAAPGTEEFYRAVGARLSQVIDETQVVDTPLHRVQAARSKDGWSKMAMSYTSEPMKELNMVYRAKMRGGKALARTVGWVVASAIATAAAAALVDALRDDDEEKTYWEKVGVATVDNVIQNLNPLSRVPVYGDDLSAWSYKIAFGIVDGVLGTDLSKYVPRTYDSSRYDTAAFESVNDLIAVLEKEDAGWYEIGYASSKVVSTFTGIGISNFWRDIVGSIVNIANGVSPKGAYKKVLALGDEEKVAANYNAFLHAKCEEFAKSKYGTTYAELSREDQRKVRKSAHSSIETTTKALFEEEYIKAWKKGDDAAITRIRSVLLATDVYDMNDIRGFFKSFVKSYYKDLYKKAKTAEAKEEIIKEAAKARAKLIGDLRVFDGYSDAKKYLTS